jgi:16S rRNA (guanine527-N7)-methyltransferase
MPLDSTQQAYLLRGASAFGITLSAEVMAKFTLFAERLEETNRTLNLTRIPPEEYVPLHFLDSLALATFWKPKPNSTLLDVGTGAGFPGVPLALLFPEIEVTLMDGTLKRLRFLDTVLGELGISNANTLHARAEEIRGKEQYDLVTARAVARLPKLLEWMLPLTKSEGRAIAYKGAGAAEEIAEAEAVLKRFKARVVSVESIRIPETEIERNLIVVARTK